MVLCSKLMEVTSPVESRTVDLFNGVGSSLLTRGSLLGRTTITIANSRTATKLIYNSSQFSLLLLIPHSTAST